MLGRITDRRRYPVPACRFDPNLAIWSFHQVEAAAREFVDAACALGRCSVALSSAPLEDASRLEHAAVWSLGIGPTVPSSDPLSELSARLTILHPATPIGSVGRPSMGGLVQAHRALWAGQRQAGKPRSTELPSAALPRDTDGTPCLAPSPRDVLRLGASIDRATAELPASLDQALVGAAWFVWAIESTAPLPDSNSELAWSAVAAWLCGSVGMRSSVLDLHGSLDAAVHRQCLHKLAASGSTAPWSAHVWRTITRACDQAMHQLGAIDQARTELLERAAAMRAPRHPSELVRRLMGSPITDVRQVERTLGITFAAANDLVERCISAGILREVTGRRRGRIYCCDASANALGQVTSSLDSAIQVGAA
ncbi:MAG: hypothetical protein FJ254_02940 [Phycisphaerae bacterium]|nr:hypothetical protein [Phycisphaerae bacterium]